jgi:hypothetical protein
VIAILDITRELLGHPSPAGPDRYRLVRPTGRYYDAYHWVSNRDMAWASADERRRTLECWISLRERHHVAWVERGGSEGR